MPSNEKQTALKGSFPTDLAAAERHIVVVD
jgi:hypothetical protein